MGDAAHRRATYEDVLNAPRHLVAEVLAGELHLQPRPRFRHARSATRLGMVLRPFDGVQGPGGWIKTLEVFRLDGATYRLVKAWHGEATCNAEPFEEIEL